MVPNLIHVYCGLITFSVFYGCHYMIVKPLYILGAGMFVGFAWAICFDYYMNIGIFTSIMGLLIYFICAAFWHVIEARSILGFFVNDYADDISSNSAEPKHEDATFSIRINLLNAVYFVGLLFYAPLLYMGLNIAIRI